MFFKTAVCVVLFARLSLSTSIAIIRSGDTVAMAVDSLLTLSGGATAYGCKVRGGPPCFFVVSGTSYADIGFDPFELGAKACKSAATFEMRVQNFQKLVQLPMLRLIRAARLDDPKHYAKFLKIGVIDVAFFGIENGRAMIEEVTYRLDPATQEPVAEVQKSGSDYEGDIFRIGEQDAVTRFMIAAGPDFFKLPIEKQVRKFVELEETAMPTVVGGSITVIKMNPTTTDIIDPGACKFVDDGHKHN